jgi:ADP-ribose pyrophosphatase YjhB (NUDIX family)
MTILRKGERIGKQGAIRLACSAVIFDAARQRVLLTRRSDNGLWCLPGGAVDPGETVAETCEREVCEETGLQVRVGRLVGIYSNPHYLVEYPDGHKVQIVALNFEAEVTGGELGLSDETTAVDYYTREEMEHLDIMEHQRERIADAFLAAPGPFIR